MLQRALVILLIGTASATSVAHASDWGNGSWANYPPPDHGYVREHAPPGNYGHRSCPPHGFSQPVRWASPVYGWAPRPHHHWHPAHGYREYGYQPRHRNDWDRRGARRDDRYDHDHHGRRGH